ncbi:hypothetical protein CROQUDRAFT_238016 [Cronartium quercuum f. sp. fusiforme G11]|uniref:Uncharacterized protein n=1 Tax=Cronartium quercuum f. sp. fusiforme G11 TaxID=708437 RepID=A0A9P6T8B9_9BASI|nr:hypothetical protein CROQUDRAFT_238016 [Cronartium quercuum f. sp. fusiforme G11]
MGCVSRVCLKMIKSTQNISRLTIKLTMLRWNLVCGLMYLAIFVNGSPTQVSTSQDSPTTKTTTDFQAVFASSSESCTKTVEVVRSGSKKGDTTVVYSSVETFHATVQTLQATVEQSDFDSHSAVCTSCHV